MGDAALVGGAQGIGDRYRELEELPRREPVLGDQRRQGLPVDELHGEEGCAVCLLHRMDGDDVGVVEGGHRPRLAAETFEPLGIRDHLLGQDLDRHLAAKLGVPREPHLTHSPLAELAENLVVEQRAADHSGSPREMRVSCLLPFASPASCNAGGCGVRQRPSPPIIPHSSNYWTIESSVDRDS